MAIRILCYNIHGGYDLAGKRDLLRLHSLMQAQNIDIGVFQEIETRASRGGSLRDIDMIAGEDYPHRLSGLCMTEDEGWYGNLIISRMPIVRGLVHNLETTSYLEPRNAVDVLVDTPHGKVRLIGTHLSLSPWERWSEVKNLVRLIDAVEETEKAPMLVMGDINEWRPSSRLLRHLDGLLTPVPCGRTFPSFFPLFRLDRVWSHNMDRPLAARVLKIPETLRLSDHLPLLIEIF